MGKVISYTEREFTAKGLNKKNKVDIFKLQEYIFEEDYEALRQLEQINVSLQDTNEPILLYPGCGADILSPLFYIQRLFPKLKQIQLYFVDQDNNFGIIKTILDDIGICFEDYGEWIQFYFEGVLIDLYFTQGDIFKMMGEVTPFDIYFERAFRIMKERDSLYEERVVSLLKEGGILISDSGFKEAGLIKIEVSQELSAYREMMIGVKR